MQKPGSSAFSPWKTDYHRSIAKSLVEFCFISSGTGLMHDLVCLWAHLFHYHFTYSTQSVFRKQQEYRNPHTASSVAVMVRKQAYPARPNRAEKTIPAILKVQLKRLWKEQSAAWRGHSYRQTRNRHSLTQGIGTPQMDLSIKQQRRSPQDQTRDRKPACTAGSRESTLGLCQNWG
jgi:hypothetical protein